jgi:hypothetical protein
VTTFMVENKDYSVPSSPYDLGTLALFQSLKGKSMCFRMGPSLYLDGRAIQCIALRGAVYCGNCEAHSMVNQPQLFSPPCRMVDVFDPPRIDLRDHILGKRVCQTVSFTSQCFTVSTNPLP